MAKFSSSDLERLHNQCIIAGVAFDNDTSIRGIDKYAARFNFRNGMYGRFFRVNVSSEIEESFGSALYHLDLLNRANEHISSGLISEELLAPLLSYYSNR